MPCNYPSRVMVVRKRVCVHMCEPGSEIGRKGGEIERCAKREREREREGESLSVISPRWSFLLVCFSAYELRNAALHHLPSLHQWMAFAEEVWLIQPLWTETTDIWWKRERPDLTWTDKSLVAAESFEDYGGAEAVWLRTSMRRSSLQGENEFSSYLRKLNFKTARNW